MFYDQGTTGCELSVAMRNSVLETYKNEFHGDELLKRVEILEVEIAPSGKGAKVHFNIKGGYDYAVVTAMSDPKVAKTVRTNLKKDLSDKFSAIPKVTFVASCW